MRKQATIGLFTMLIISAGFRKKSPVSINVPDGWPKPVYNFRKHPLSDKKIQLGRLLFYDPILSKDSTISCASCHSPYNTFTHVDHSLSHGINGRIGNRNSPVLVNLAWNRSFMWDGAVRRLDEQAQKPICNPLEMDETMTGVVVKLKASAKYAMLFNAAFSGEGVTDEHVQQSLSQFMLTLVSANAKYDKVMRGEDKFNAQEANGYALFKKNCSACHTEPLFTNGGFENNGLAVDETLNDIGKMKVSHNSGDSLKFKIPTLRNIEYSGPYMHDGRFKSLGMVLNNYIRGIQQSPTLSPRLQKGIYLTVNEKADLIAFLLTLSDKSFLTNPLYGYPAY